MTSAHMCLRRIEEYITYLGTYVGRYVPTEESLFHLQRQQYT